MEAHCLKTKVLRAALKIGERVVADMGQIQVQTEYGFSRDVELVSSVAFSHALASACFLECPEYH